MTSGPRPRRRARGERSIFQRASDGQWVVRLDLGYVRGRRKRATRYASSEREALAELKRLHREFAAGRLVVNAGQMTVAEYLDYWLAELLPGTVKASTEASYADMTRRHIVPGLGHLSLAKLSRDDVRRFVRQLGRTAPGRRSGAVRADGAVRALDPAAGPGRCPARGARRTERGAGSAVASLRAPRVRALGARRSPDAAGSRRRGPAVRRLRPGAGAWDTPGRDPRVAVVSR